jgi:hypothetical protein
MCHSTEKRPNLSIKHVEAQDYPPSTTSSMHKKMRSRFSRAVLLSTDFLEKEKILASISKARENNLAT